MVYYLINVFSIFKKIGIKSTDSQDTVIRKTSLTAMAFIAGSLAGIWGSIFFVYKLENVGIIAYSYFLISYLGILIFWRTKSEKLLLNSQLISAIFLPFFATIVMGGFILSAVVIVWSLLTPFGSMFFSNYKKSPKWYFLFVILLITAGFLSSLFQPTQILPSEIINLFFVLNLAGISFVIYTIVYYFIDEKEKAINLLNKVAQNQFSEFINKLDLAESNHTIDESFSNPVLFMIIDFNGVATYSKIFGSDQIFDDQLISGLLTAINSLGQNAFGAKILKEINYKDFFLFFEILKDKRFVYAFEGNYFVGKNKFGELLHSLNLEEYNFIFENNWKLINNNSKLNELIDKVFS